MRFAFRFQWNSRASVVGMAFVLFIFIGAGKITHTLMYMRCKIFEISMYIIMAIWKDLLYVCTYEHLLALVNIFTVLEKCIITSI